MECLTEFKCSVYADGELTEEEVRQIEEHLESCASCKELAAAFREENRLLVDCIQEIDLMEAAQAMPVRSVAPEAYVARPRDVVKFGGLLVGLATMIRLAMSSPENFVLPSSPVNLDWLDPSNLSGKLNWLVGAIAFVAVEGASGMISLINSLSVVTMVVLILAGVVTLARRSARKGAMVATLGAILLMVAGTPSSYALDIRNSGPDKLLTIPAAETVDDSLFATGDSVIIDGTVNGDVIAFARQVTVNGTIKGNLFTAAQSLNLGGSVEGSIIAGGQSIQFNGNVAHNLLSFGQITIAKEATVGGDAATFGNESRMNGSVARSFYAFGIADIAGSIGRNVMLRGSSVTVLPSARIGGDLTAYVNRKESVHIEPGAVITGKQTIEVSKPGPNKYSTFKFYFSELLHLAAAFVTGLILMLLFPRFRRVSLSDAVSILKSAGIGFLGVVAMPIAAIIVLVTLIGIPVALIGMIAWVLGLYLAKIIIANFIGRTLLMSESDRLSSLALNLFIGLALVFIVINLPYVGGLIHFLLVLIGFGALVMSVYGSFQPQHGSGR